LAFPRRQLEAEAVPLQTGLPHHGTAGAICQANSPVHTAEDGKDRAMDRLTQ